MIRSLIIAAVLFGGALLSSLFSVGYSSAGENYISKHREARKSLRPGGLYYMGGPHGRGAGGFRGGK